MKLDLGGTACYEMRHGAVSISRDDLDNSGDELTPQINGDYNFMPFADDSFDEALGSCYLEEQPDWFELARVMKFGGIVKVKSCGAPYTSEHQIIAQAKAAGFHVISRMAMYEEDGEMIPDTPLVLSNFKRLG